MATVGVKGLMP